MKTASRLLILTFLGCTFGAQAGPMGPSAKVAARLKKAPTSAWLAHYLPDDRYKIAGGVWKYVSTDLDTYYHRPNSPLMLRQSAGRVIGFSSAADAEEAGYKPAPGAGGFESFNDPTPVDTSVKGPRVTLSDGTSSIVLPRGWKKAAGRVQIIQGGRIAVDRISGPRGQRLEITSVSAPATANLDFGRMLNVTTFKSMMDTVGQVIEKIGNNAQNSGSVNSQFQGQKFLQQFQAMQKKQAISSVRVSGIDGVGIFNDGVLMAGQPRRLYSVGRGSKAWNIGDFSKTSDDAAPIVKTLQLR